MNRTPAKFSLYFPFSIFFFSFFSIINAAQPDPHILQLRAEPSHISPNDDDLQDQAFFYPVLQSNVKVSRWTLEIITAKRKRRTMRLTGVALPALIKWDGLDKNGDRAPDGDYLARLTLMGSPNTAPAEQLFAVDTVPPVAELTLSTNVFDRSFLEDGNLIFHPRMFDASPADHWLLQVIDASGRSVYVHWSSGPVHDVAWNGMDMATRVLVPQGNYRVVFQVWDRAGNSSPPVFVDLKVNVTPREMLERNLHRIKVNETGMGLIVQLPVNVLFQKKGKRIEITDNGMALLREAAILANAYPNASIKLDGYSHSSKKASQDRDLASLYAWRVYSAMIKNGNVKPSRLNVRGRGRSPMFDRRAVGVPILKNAVELVLEGPGPW